MAYRLVYRAITAEGEIYDGEFEDCITLYEGATTAEALASATISAVAQQGGTLLSIRIWQDGSSWKIETTAHGSPLLPWWAIILIILAICVGLAVVIYGLITLSQKVIDLIYGPPPIIDPETGEVIYQPSAISKTIGTIAIIGVILVGSYLFLKAKPWEKAEKAKELRAR